MVPENAEAPIWEELLKISDSERITFVGSLDGSFPGAYGKAWNFLTQAARRSDGPCASFYVFCLTARQKALTIMSRLELKAEAATAGTSMENNSSLVALGTISGSAKRGRLHKRNASSWPLPEEMAALVGHRRGKSASWKSADLHTVRWQSRILCTITMTKHLRIRRRWWETLSSRVSQDVHKKRQQGSRMPTASG